jgi:hypothetical protein
MKISGEFKSSQGSQFLDGNQANSNQRSVTRNNVSNRTSIMQSNANITPTNHMANSIH